MQGTRLKVSFKIRVENIASLDIGSFTARLLIARKIDSPGLFRPLARKRAYIRLAEGFEGRGSERIRPEAIERTVDVLKEFSRSAKEYGVETIWAVTTGVVRRAANRDRFLRLLQDETGLKVKLISGEDEAVLTLKGVTHALDIKNESTVIFDLGGGTTEVILSREGNMEIRSLPLGAALLSEKFLVPDPPDGDQIRGLEDFIDRELEKTLFRDRYSSENGNLVGSGGTVTTLAAMISQTDVRDITPEKLNGFILDQSRIQCLFEHIKSVPVSKRLELPGLDEERAEVILAGTAVVLRILEYFQSREMTVCCSDILEGILISCLKGDENE